MRKRGFLTVFFLICTLVYVPNASAKILGTVGKTYPIIEPDALAEIKERASKINLKELFAGDRAKEKLENFRPKGIRKLPRAEKDKTFLVDMTYRWDGPDIALPCKAAIGINDPYADKLRSRCQVAHGEGWEEKRVVLYPTGYTFNPLDYVSLTKTIMVIDGADPEQVEWFESSEYHNDLATTILITDGSWHELSEKFKRPVFYATQVITDRFALEAVPSVIAQKGNSLEVTEIAIEQNEKTD